MAPAQASAFQHFAAISSGHALPESMNAQTAMDARLVGSFGHTLSFQSKKSHCEIRKRQLYLNKYLAGIYFWFFHNYIYLGIPESQTTPEGELNYAMIRPVTDPDSSFSM